MMKDSDLGCFKEFDIKDFRSRFVENLTEQEVDKSGIAGEPIQQARKRCL
jgi:hypothetical protein